MDVRRFAPRQDAESQNPLEPLSRELLPSRGKGRFFWLLFFGPLQRKVTRPRSGRKLCNSFCAYALANAAVLMACGFAHALRHGL